MTKAPLCAIQRFLSRRLLSLCTPPVKLLFHDKPASFSWHTPAAIVAGCLLPGQAHLPREKNSIQRAASIFVVAVLPLNLPAQEMFYVLETSPCYPAPFTSSPGSLLWWVGAVASPCAVQGPSSAPLAAHLLPSAHYPSTEGSREIFSWWD